MASTASWASFEKQEILAVPLGILVYFSQHNGNAPHVFILNISPHSKVNYTDNATLHNQAVVGIYTIHWYSMNLYQS